MAYPFRPLLSAFVVLPASAALYLRLYLRNNPLSSERSRKIVSTLTVSPSCERSSSLRLVNPKSHVYAKDSYSIHLSEHEIKGLSDEEVLARFYKGFFAGWIFTPERYLLRFLSLFGMKFVPVGFSGIETQVPVQSKSLPPIHSTLFDGNFMLLDKSFHSGSGEGAAAIHNQENSFVDVAYGDNRKGFAGFHRFELTRDSEDKGPGATICYSSISCNPTINELPLPDVVFEFHKFYARTLFRDGIAGVLHGCSEEFI